MPLVVDAVSTQDGADFVEQIATCPEGTAPLAVGAATDSATRFQLDRLRLTSQGASARWHRAPGADAPRDLETRAQLVCADEHVFECVAVESGATSVDETPGKWVALTCPPDHFAVAADFEITGDAGSVEVSSSMALGLFAPVGWRVDARVMDGSSPSWGLSVSMRCVPADAFAQVTMQPLTGGVDTSITGSSGSFDWSDVTHAFRYGVLEQPSLPLGHAARMLFGAPGGWAAAHTYMDRDSSMVVVELTGYSNSSPPYDVAGYGFLVTEPDAFEDALATCPSSSLPASVLSRFRIGADILFGVEGGGGGVIFLPGTGPVPVDPEPFRAAFTALPVAVAQYADTRERDERIVDILAGLDAERTPWSLVDDPAQVLRGSGVTLLAPRDEAAAVRWLSDHRAELAALSHTVLVFLQQDGPAEAELARW